MRRKIAELPWVTFHVDGEIVLPVCNMTPELGYYTIGKIAIKDLAEAVRSSLGDEFVMEQIEGGAIRFYKEACDDTA